MIQIIPSIAILNGKVVRLIQGNYFAETSYNESPLDVAKKYEAHGIEVVHLVDLDGAQRGSPVNYHILEAIAGHTSLKVDFTGGIHTDGDINKAYEYGATFITAASIAATNPNLFGSWIISYGRERITLGADSLDRKIAIRGWQKNTTIDLFEHIDYFYSRGLKYVKTTDISRDGVMQGPNFKLYRQLMKTFPGMSILASGGVKNMDDVDKLNEIGIFAVIIGKAFYEGRIKLKELEKYLVTHPIQTLKS
jgi:phosphoribosylformimino-5-aminoimidazole carboxamide ribotide isomerase